MLNAKKKRLIEKRKVLLGDQNRVKRMKEQEQTKKNEEALLKKSTQPEESEEEKERFAKAWNSLPEVVARRKRIEEERTAWSREPVVNLPIPSIKVGDLLGYTLDYLPTYDKLPKSFKNDSSPYYEFVSKWFFSGADTSSLIAREGVNAKQALFAVKCVLMSWDISQEHKMAGASWLLYQWFEIKPSYKV
jgi:hypothetical protein